MTTDHAAPDHPATLRTYSIREEVEVWERFRPRAHGPDRPGYWRRGLVMTLGPSGVVGPPPLSLPSLPEGHVRIMLLAGAYPEDLRGETITHNTRDPETADLVRRPDDNDGSAPS